MHGRFAAAVPIAMWSACWEYDKSSRTRLILLTLDLQAHGAAEDVEQLVDHVLVEARRRTFAWRGLDAVDAAAGRPRIATDQCLRHPLAARLSKSTFRRNSMACSPSWPSLNS